MFCFIRGYPQEYFLAGTSCKAIIYHFIIKLVLYHYLTQVFD